MSGHDDLGALTRAQWKGFWRDKQNWFWLLAFPLMFLLLFGFLLRDVGASKSQLALVGDVQFVAQMPPQAKRQFDAVFTTTHYRDEAAALAKVRSGDLAGALVEDGATLRLYYSAADQVAAATVRGALEGFIGGANQALSGKPPVLSLVAEQVEDESLKPIQYMAPGLLAWAVAMGGVFSTAMPLVTWRTTKLLRRLRRARGPSSPRVRSSGSPWPSCRPPSSSPSGWGSSACS